MRLFLSGNEAVAHGARLARPQVVAAYPITPQTVVVERLSEMVASNQLSCELMHVESEHSALSACMGASAVGARTFTATSSQGLLYMVECLHYASGGRFPIVMMNANRSVALPWNIYGDQRDSLSVLDAGWIQIHVANAQEALDMTLQAFAVGEHPDVLTPVMINLDGFVLTHTYEAVEVPEQPDVDAFLPEFRTANRLDLSAPKSLGFSAGPDENLEFKHQQHEAMLRARDVLRSVDDDFARRFGRRWGGSVEAYRCEDAEAILVTLGSLAGTLRGAVDRARTAGLRVGLLRLRVLRPFPAEELQKLLGRCLAVGVVEKNISFGYEGTLFTNVASALARSGEPPWLASFVAGLGGRDVTVEQGEEMLRLLVAAAPGDRSAGPRFIDLRSRRR